MQLLIASSCSDLASVSICFKILYRSIVAVSDNYMQRNSYSDAVNKFILLS